MYTGGRLKIMKRNRATVKKPMLFGGGFV